MKDRRSRVWPWAALTCVAVLLLVALGVRFVVLGARTALEAERRLHAMILVSEVIERHLESSGGRWPASWDELGAVPPLEWSVFEWPRDRPTLEEYVAIRFGADAEVLARQTVDEFDGISPTGPVYENYKWLAIEPLLKKLRKE